MTDNPNTIKDFLPVTRKRLTNEVNGLHEHLITRIDLAHGRGTQAIKKAEASAGLVNRLEIQVKTLEGRIKMLADAVGSLKGAESDRHPNVGRQIVKATIEDIEDDGMVTKHPPSSGMVSATATQWLKVIDAIPAHLLAQAEIRYHQPGSEVLSMVSSGNPEELRLICIPLDGDGYGPTLPKTD